MSELTCYAKRHEFDENGLGDFNVTMHSVSAYFKTHNINLSTQVRQQESQVYDAVAEQNRGGELLLNKRQCVASPHKTGRLAESVSALWIPERAEVRICIFLCLNALRQQTMTPFVLGIAPCLRLSISTAARIARAAALNSPSIL